MKTIEKLMEEHGLRIEIQTVMNPVEERLMWMCRVYAPDKDLVAGYTAHTHENMFEKITEYISNNWSI